VRRIKSLEERKGFTFGHQRVVVPKFVSGWSASRPKRLETYVGRSTRAEMNQVVPITAATFGAPLLPSNDVIKVLDIQRDGRAGRLGREGGFAQNRGRNGGGRTEVAVVKVELRGEKLKAGRKGIKIAANLLEVGSLDGDDVGIDVSHKGRALEIPYVASRAIKIVSSRAFRHLPCDDGADK
jgi:hypothetical protein